MSKPIIPAVTLPVPEIPRDLLSSDTGKEENRKKSGENRNTGDQFFDPKSTDDLLSLLLMEEGERGTRDKKKTKPEGKPKREKNGRQANQEKAVTSAVTNELKPAERKPAEEKTQKVRKEPVTGSGKAEKPVTSEGRNPIDRTYGKVSLVLCGPGISKKLSGHHFVGSDPRCADISIGGPEGKYISARHAEIVRLGDSWYIEDAGSRNGTFVNGRRIEAGRRMRIIAGDSIRLADLDFKLGSGAA